MAIEFTSNCHSIGLVENVCRELVRKGTAKAIKDSRIADFETSRYTNDKSKREELQDKGFDVVVYRQYLVNIKTASIFLPWTADIRFWYDKRTNRAGIKLSAEALQSILESMTAIEYLRKLNIKLGGDNGKLTLDKIAQALTEVFAKVTQEKPQIEARRYEPKIK